MFVRIDAADNTPVYEQIMSQVKYAIATGVQRPGEALPSVRQLAVDILVNPNTVARSYRELEREGIVERRRGIGLFVTEDAPRMCRRERRTLITGKMGQVLREAAQAELSREEIERIFESELSRAIQEASKSKSREEQAEE